VHDVPYNGDPALVRPVEGAPAALARLRAAGLRLALVSNQSGIGRGLLTRAAVDAVNDRVEECLGPFDHRAVCPHTTADGCACRKPRPGLVLQACRVLGVRPEECVVVGDIGADVGAATAAGAAAVLVPTPVTRSAEIAAADVVAATLADAVDLILTGRLAGGAAGTPGAVR
jgi:histidinol-phosphate phosphatase family protein